MPDLLDLLDAPLGTIATTRVGGMPWMAAIVAVDEQRRLFYLDSEMAAGPAYFGDQFTHGGRAIAAVRQVHPTQTEITPRWPELAIDATDEEEETYLDACEPLEEQLEALPLGAIVDASPESSSDPEDVRLAMHVEPESWAPLTHLPFSIDDIRISMSGGRPRVAWIDAVVEDLRRASFELIPAVVGWRHEHMARDS